MLDFAKLVHEAIGIESPRAFIALFALSGLLLFGGLGWLVDKGYRAKLAESARTSESVVPSNPGVDRPQRTQEERIFLPPEVTSKDLTRLYEDNTSIQADQLAKSYLGKWMKVAVQVINVDKKWGEYSLIGHLEHDGVFDHNSNVGMMYFASVWADRVSLLPRGAKVTVIGIVNNIGPSGIGLKDCELVSETK